MIPTDEIIIMAKEAGFRRFDIVECRNGMPHIYQGGLEALTAFASIVSARAAKDEREACAKAMQPHLRDMISRGKAADLIRARGDQS